MQEAKITKNSQQVENQPILDTDDLIFELGRQVITHLETKKKLERILKKTARDITNSRTILDG